MHTQAEDLFNRVIEKSLADHGMVPEMYYSGNPAAGNAPDKIAIGTPTGAIPMIGFGAGAIPISLFGRGRELLLSKAAPSRSSQPPRGA
jgi:hypothetical protein